VRFNGWTNEGLYPEATHVIYDESEEADYSK
jgi:hypothetical protein